MTNTRLTATFSAPRNDAKKLSVGMPVEFMQDGNSFNGSIRYKFVDREQWILFHRRTGDSLYWYDGSGTPLTEPTHEVGN
jgi:hypothetical protein